jgi:alkaline phosphatase D
VAELFTSREEECPIPGFAGAWHTTFGRLVMEQEAGAARGSYSHKGGSMRGELSGNVLRGTWHEPEHGKEGSFELTLDDDGNSFRGWFAYAGSAKNDGPWNGVRLDLLSEEEGGNPGGWNSLPEGPLLAGPMLGEAGETDARVWAQARDTSALTLSVFREDGSELRSTVQPAWEDWLCVTFHVQGLNPGERCSYEIRSLHGKTARGELRAGPPRDARRLKLAFGSCFWNFPDQTLAIFDAIEREAADVFLMLGDTSYFSELDWQSEHTMMLTHLRHRNNPAVRRVFAGLPAIGVWDDHDFGPNDSDSSFAGKDMALRAFQRSWANGAYGTEGAPGVFGSARLGPAEVFWFDTRYHRIEGSIALGEAQLAWLTERLAESDAPVKIIASPSQVLPQHPIKHGWACFRRDAPQELEHILSFIERRDIQGVVFLSGDLHMANLIHAPARPVGGRLGPELWELTSSPLANDPWRMPQLGADPYLLKEVADRTNYGVVDIDLDRAGGEVALILKDEGGGVIFTAPIDLGALRVR